MMEWRDEGLVLSARPYGEHGAIVEIFTGAHGRQPGVVRGGASRRMAPHLQPGAQVQAVWRARLDDHLGTFTVEPLRSRAHLMGDRLALAGLGAVTALLQVTLPERAPHPALWRASVALLDRLDRPDWQSDYLRWEMALLEELGYGLDLTSCAVTGAAEDLAFVSPRTGRAVTRAGAGDWAGRLLPLPEGMAGGAPLTLAAVVQGAAITGHFLARELAEEAGGRPLPEARARLLDLFARGTGSA